MQYKFSNFVVWNGMIILRNSLAFSYQVKYTETYDSKYLFSISDKEKWNEMKYA